MALVLRSTAFWVLACWLFLTPGHVAAGTTGSQSEEEADLILRVQALYDRGSRLYAERAYAEAVIFFEQALELIQVPDIHYNIARSYERLAQYGRAIEHFEAYLALHMEQEGRAAPDLADVEQVLRDLRRRAAPPEVKLSVVTEPPGADVYLDSRDTVRGQTPFEIELEHGVYTVILEAEEYEPVERQIELRRGEPQSLTFRLRRRTDLGRLLFDINVRGARIYVQGQVKGLTPYPEEIPVPAGRRQVTIEKDRYTTLSRVVEVTAGETKVVRENLHLDSPPYSWRGYLGWTFVGFGLAGIGGGVTIKLVGDGRYFRDESAFKDLQLYQNLSFGLGGALMGLGTALVIWEYARDAVDSDDLVPRSERIRAGSEPPPVAVHVTPGGGVGLSGQFLF